MTKRKPPRHSQTAYVPMNDGRHQRDRKPWFHVQSVAPSAAEARRIFSPDADEWKKLFRADGWRIIKVKIEVMR